MAANTGLATDFVEVTVAPLRVSDPTFIGPFKLLGRMWSRPHATSYLGLDVLRRIAEVTTFRATGRVAVPREEIDRSFAAAGRIHVNTIAPVLDSGWHEGTPWLAVRYVPGPLAAETLSRAPGLAEDQLLPFAAALAAGLDALHRADVIHTDLGPHTVVLTERGPVIVGYGGPTLPRGRRGGPWVGPESGREIGKPVDVYAWGWLVAAAAMGPENVKFKELRRGSRLLSTDLSGLPAPLPGLVAGALDAYTRGRPTAAQLTAALPLRHFPPRRIAPVLLAPRSYQPPVPGRLRRRLLTGVGAMAIFAISAVAFYSAWR